VIRPALAALATLLTTWIYNDFFWAITLIQTGDKRPITSALANLQGQFVSNQNMIAAAALIAAIPTLVVYILLFTFDANQANQFATFVRNGANFFSLGLTDLFQPANQKIAVAVNYGIAALIWLVITNFVTGLVRRVG